MSQALIERLCSAINAHDLERAAACFHPDYRSEQPAHPDRVFVGRSQVRANWAAMFVGVPDVAAQLVSAVSAPDGWIWAEWVWAGTRTDGRAFDHRGVTLFQVAADLIVSGRLYMEPLEVAGDGIVQAVENISGTRPVDQPDD